MTYKPSPEALERAARIMSGVKNKYKADIHISMILDIFSTGQDIASFCVYAGICRDTFYEWIKNNKDFALAYEEARELARVWLEQKGAEGIQDPGNFNNVLWNTLMRNRCGYTDKRKIRIKGLAKAKTHTAKAKVIHDGMAEGLYTADEAKALISIVADGAKIDEISDQAKDLAMIKETLGKGKL